MPYRPHVDPYLMCPACFRLRLTRDRSFFFIVEQSTEMGDKPFLLFHGPPGARWWSPQPSNGAVNRAFLRCMSKYNTIYSLLILRPVICSDKIQALSICLARTSRPVVSLSNRLEPGK